MITKTTIAAALISLSTLAAVPAQAVQPHRRSSASAAWHGWTGNGRRPSGSHYRHRTACRPTKCAGSCATAAIATSASSTTAARSTRCAPASAATLLPGRQRPHRRDPLAQPHLTRITAGHASDREIGRCQRPLRRPIRPAVLDRRPLFLQSPLAAACSRRRHSICGASLRAAAGRRRIAQVPLGPSRRNSEQSRSEGRGRRYASRPTTASSFAMRAGRRTARRCAARSSSCTAAPSSSKNISRRSTTSAGAASRSRLRFARAGRLGAAARQSAQGPCARLRRPRERFRDGHAGGGPAGLPAALLRARAFDRRGGGAALGAAAARRRSTAWC